MVFVAAGPGDAAPRGDHGHRHGRPAGSPAATRDSYATSWHGPAREQGARRCRAAHHRPGDVLAGRYRLIDLLDRERGRPVLARPRPVLERDVAVHIIAADDERAAAAARGRPHAPRPSSTAGMLRVLDVDETADGAALVVNEWGSGTSPRHPAGRRRAARRRAGRPGWSPRWPTRSLAHAAGVAHGRLVPENVLIDRDGVGPADRLRRRRRPARPARPAAYAPTDVVDLGRPAVRRADRPVGRASAARRSPPAPAAARPGAAAAAGAGRRSRAPLDALCDHVLNPTAGARGRRSTDAAVVSDALREFVGDPTGRGGRGLARPRLDHPRTGRADGRAAPPLPDPPGRATPATGRRPAIPTPSPPGADRRRRRRTPSDPGDAGRTPSRRPTRPADVRPRPGLPIFSTTTATRSPGSPTAPSRRRRPRRSSSLPSGRCSPPSPTDGQPRPARRATVPAGGHRVRRRLLALGEHRHRRRHRQRRAAGVVERRRGGRRATAARPSWLRLAAARRGLAAGPARPSWSRSTSAAGATPLGAVPRGHDEPLAVRAEHRGAARRRRSPASPPPTSTRRATRRRRTPTWPRSPSTATRPPPGARSTYTQNLGPGGLKTGVGLVARPRRRPRRSARST